MLPRKYTDEDLYPFRKKKGRKKIAKKIKDFVVYTRIEKILPFVFVIIVLVGVGMYVMKPTYYDVLPKMPYINSVKEKVDQQLDIIADITPVFEQEGAGEEMVMPHLIEGLTGKMKVKTEDGRYTYYLLFVNRVQPTDQATYELALVPIPHKIQDGNKSVEVESGLADKLGDYYKLIEAVERKSR